jgi:urate oxidase
MACQANATYVCELGMRNWAEQKKKKKKKEKCEIFLKKLEKEFLKNKKSQTNGNRSGQ